MDRLNFLKTMGLLATGPLINWLPAASRPATVGSRSQALPKVQFQGTAQGQILASWNAGQDWQLHADLGSDYRIHGFTYKDGQVQASITHAGRPFPLFLNASGRHWLSQPAG